MRPPWASTVSRGLLSIYTYHPTVDLGWILKIPSLSFFNFGLSICLAMIFFPFGCFSFLMRSPSSNEVLTFVTVLSSRSFSYYAWNDCFLLVTLEVQSFMERSPAGRRTTDLSRVTVELIYHIHNIIVLYVWNRLTITNKFF